MNNDNTIVSLPEGFDGTFKFTNFTDKEFRAKWGNVEYIFPANASTPIIIENATPREIQNIRKKFARDLATLVFYSTDKFKHLDSTGGSTPALYTDDDLAPLIQKCLEPLPIGQLKMKTLPKNHEEKFTRDENGNPRSRVVSPDEDLKQGGSVVA